MKGDTIARVRRQQALRRGRVNWPRPPQDKPVSYYPSLNEMARRRSEAMQTRTPDTVGEPLPMPWLG